MYPKDAERVAAVGANLLAEAGGEATVLLGKLLGIHPEVAVVGSNGLLRGGNQVLVLSLARHLVELIIKLRQLGNSSHRLLLHKEWGLKGHVSARHEKRQPIVDQRLIQQHAVPHKVVPPVASNGRAPLCIRQSEHLHKVDVRQLALPLLDHIVELLDSLVLLHLIRGEHLVQVAHPDDGIQVLIVRHRHRVRHEVADALEELVALGRYGVALSLLGLDLDIDRLALSNQVIRILLGLLLHRNLLVLLPKLPPQLVNLELKLPPLYIDGNDLIDSLHLGVAAPLRLLD
mmetsp:Transcript_38303/g.95920  ORF Transcript_38303/g.95920 Transcript_38303/m.95920 type:complete len:288 (-) Transcript_38303:74-937(-)